MFRFRITVEPISPAPDGPKLQFECTHHDDIIGIASRMPGRIELPDDEAKGLSIGMKIFGETILKNRNNPLFSPIRPAFSEFMKNLKAHLRENDAKKEAAKEAAVQE